MLQLHDSRYISHSGKMYLDCLCVNFLCYRALFDCNTSGCGVEFCIHSDYFSESLFRHHVSCAVGVGVGFEFILAIFGG